MRTVTTFLAVGVALGAIASGCSPNPPTDGFFGCASAGSRCPAAFPYCDPTDHRCYATAPVDSGPRPDTGPVPDTGAAGREYMTCGAPANCGGLACIGGSCMTACTGAGGTDVCARVDDGPRHGVRAVVQRGDARLHDVPEHAGTHRHGWHLPVRADDVAVSARVTRMDQYGGS